MIDFLNYLRSEDGASGAEYALILAIVGTAIAGAMLILGDSIGSAVAKDANCIANRTTCP